MKNLKKKEKEKRKIQSPSVRSQAEVKLGIPGEMSEFEGVQVACFLTCLRGLPAPLASFSSSPVIHQLIECSQPSMFPTFLTETHGQVSQSYPWNEDR